MRSRLQRVQRRNKNRQIIATLFIFTALPLIFSKVQLSKATGSYSVPVGVSPTPSPIAEAIKEEVKEIKPIKIIEIKEVKEPEDEIKKTDELLGSAVDEFFKSNSQRSEVRMIMSCLLNRESKHNTDKNKGDGGKAEGPLQYHEGTWVGFRKLMIKQGYATEIDSQYNLKEAIRTTVWAIADGRAANWGPILRYQNKRYSEASCPTPSFNKVINLSKK